MHISDSQKWLLLAAVVLLGWLLVALSPILSPFLTAILLAYLGDPLVDRLESWKVSRTNGVIITFLVLTLVIVLSVLLIIPAVLQQIEHLINNIPVIANWITTVAVPYLESQLDIDLIEYDWAELTQNLDWAATSNVVKTILSNVTQSSFAVLGAIGNLVLVPVVTFYLLRDWDLLVERLAELMPRYYIGTISGVASECHEMLGAFFRGQLLVMAAQGVMYSVGLMLIGLDLGLLIGMLAGLVSIVPYLGSIVGISAGLIAAFFQFGDWVHLLLVLAVFGIGQALEGTVLTPKLVGDRIGLHPVAVIFAVLAGGQLFGFVGILLALPAAAVLNVLLRRIHNSYRGSSLYGQAAKAVVEPQDEQTDIASPAEPTEKPEE
ncbi:AI-2E family transporter [Reinekea marinisedimentorum]|uniref:Putative PurR-regulated permease PerM n=1 Tax=Reinekea marinisedimentorum TaxID=230495 RepID=A0A4R3IAW5_9GAMM|nr:AI-2E family transporter [Reinekea marinisedimentorum]TCS42649.1 putative PurR-regulated permease PerM [Reinekea marinisedimentorum]